MAYPLDVTSIDAALALDPFRIDRFRLIRPQDLGEPTACF